MGRPLFSVNYPQPHPAVHVDPELPDEHPPVCERWSYSKPFDPDSDEFFLDEIYEAPVDSVTLENRDQVPLSPIDDATSSESGSSADEADRVDREALIIAREVIDLDNVGVVRRVNQASEQRLRTEATNDTSGNQPTAGPRTIIPISLTPGRPQPVVIPSPQTPTFTAPSTPPSASTMATPGTSFPFHASPQDATPRLYTWERDNYDPYWAVRAPLNRLPSSSPTPNRRPVASHWHVSARGVRSVAF